MATSAALPDDWRQAYRDALECYTLLEAYWEHKEDADWVPLLRVCDKRLETLLVVLKRPLALLRQKAERDRLGLPDKVPFAGAAKGTACELLRRIGGYTLWWGENLEKNAERQELWRGLDAQLEAALPIDWEYFLVDIERELCALANDPKAARLLSDSPAKKPKRKRGGQRKYSKAESIRANETHKRCGGLYAETARVLGCNDDKALRLLVDAGRQAAKAQKMATRNKPVKGS